jgi:hypothetical protein
VPDKPLEWSDFAMQLYEKLTGRGAEVTYEFDNLEIFVPDQHSEAPRHAKWKLNGTLRVRSRDTRAERGE